MQNRIVIFILGAAMLTAPAPAQTSPLPLPPPVEKELAARASNVTEVTLGKNMLGFAAKVMNGKNRDEAGAQRLIEGLDGIYVRSYEFDKEGQYSTDEVEQLRKYFETSEWSPMVREHERKNGETTDVMVKLVNGESRGMFILTAEPKELTVVLILGPIRMDELGELRGIGGLGALRSVVRDATDRDKDKIMEKNKERAGERAAERARERDKEKEDKVREKDERAKEKTGDDQ
jgi:Sec-independent protein translocase protein TatA